MNYPKDLEPKDVLYDLVLDKPGITYFDIVDMVEDGSPLKNSNIVNTGLKLLQEDDLIVGKNAAKTYYGKVIVTKEYYPVKGLFEILKVKGRKIGRRLLDKFKQKLGQKEEKYLVPVTERFGPDYFDADIAIFTLERQAWAPHRKSGWLINYEKREYLNGVRSYSSNVDLRLEVTNSRYSPDSIDYVGDYDEVEISATFKRLLGEKVTTIPDTAWGFYVKKIAKSIVPEINSRTRWFYLEAHRTLLKSGSKSTANQALDELEAIIDGEEPKEFLDITMPILEGPIFGKLNLKRKDHRRKYREYVSYFRDRINLIGTMKEYS